MNYLKCFFGLVLIAVLCVKNSHALTCYECNSASDRRCLGDVNNKLDDELKKPCPDRKDDKPYTLCRKIKQVIDFEVNGLQPDSRVIRTCGYENGTYANRCYQRSGFGGRQEVCACQGDSCNTGSTIYVGVTLLMASVGIALQLRLF